MTSSKNAKLECKLIAVGDDLLNFSSVASTQPIELIMILDRLEGVLSEVGQTPSWSMKDALRPAMKALISDRLLKHSNIGVTVSVASCMSELTRITAPNEPYDDDIQMKDILQLTVMALGMLSSDDTRRYGKALRILGNMTDVKTCVLMVDLECDELIAKMFKLFLSAIRYLHSGVVFRQMESIMTHTLKESEEISEELLSILLSSINRKEHVSSRSWMLGKKVMMNCAVILHLFLRKMVRSRNLDFDDYSTILATICLNSPEDEHENQISSWYSSSANVQEEQEEEEEQEEKQEQEESEGSNAVCTLVKAE